MPRRQRIFSRKVERLIVCGAHCGRSRQRTGQDTRDEQSTDALAGQNTENNEGQ